MREQALRLSGLLLGLAVASCASPRPPALEAPVVHVAPAKVTAGAWLETGAAPPEPAPAARVEPADDTHWGPGDRVEVEWHGVWYAATVREVEPGGQYLIHYDGYGKEWDEAVGPSRIRDVGVEEDDDSP